MVDDRGRDRVVDDLGAAVGGAQEEGLDLLGQELGGLGARAHHRARGGGQDGGGGCKTKKKRV